MFPTAILSSIRGVNIPLSVRGLLINDNTSLISRHMFRLAIVPTDTTSPLSAFSIVLELRAMALNMLSARVGASLSKRVCPAVVVQAPRMYSWEPKEVETHTGQKWEKDDYRLARYVDKEKQVNPTFAIDLINQVPPKACKQRVVYCDGGGGPLGHPKVYINLDKPGNHSCNYCGLRFFKEDSH